MENDNYKSRKTSLLSSFIDGNSYGSNLDSESQMPRPRYSNKSKNQNQSGDNNQRFSEELTQLIAQLPRDLLAEKSLIAGLLIDGQAYDEIIDVGIKRKDFFHPIYGLLFEVIQEMAVAKLPVDYVTLCSRLHDLNKLEEIGGQRFVVELVEDFVSAANVPYYAKIVKDKSSLRDIIRTAQQLVERGVQFSGDINDFLAEVEGAFFKITNEAKNGKMIRLHQALKENLKALQDNSRKAGEISGLSTGYPRLDQLLLGLQPGQLLILAARPAMGKTAFALNIALNICETTELPVVIFSLEMIAPELSMRLLTSKAKIDSKLVRMKNFNDADMRRMSKTILEMSKMPIFINDSGNINILDVQSQCRKIKAELGLGLVVVDYLQLMRSYGKHQSREQEISEISRGLKAMAKELECPVLALSQLNRSVESRPDKRPNVSDLRESGSIEQDADVVMMIYRDEVYYPDSKDKGLAEIIVGKNRSGEVGKAKLAFVGAYTSFENLTYQGNDSNGGPE